MTIGVNLVWVGRMAGLVAVTTAAGSAAWFAANRDRVDDSAVPGAPVAAPAARRLEAWPQPFIVRIGNPDRTTSDEQQQVRYIELVAASCVRALDVMRPGDPDWLDDAGLQDLNAARASFGEPPIVVIELPSYAALGDPALLEAPRGCW